MKKVIISLLTLSLLLSSAVMSSYAANEQMEENIEQLDSATEAVPEENLPEMGMPAEVNMTVEEAKEMDEPTFDTPLFGEPVFPEAQGTVEPAEDFELCSTDFSLMATSGSCGDNVTYTLDAKGTLTISGEGQMYNYHGFMSTSLLNSPFYNYNVKAVVVENGVTSIGSYAFSSCKGLMSVTIPDSVTSIGAGAFSGCSGLTSITIPVSVTSIGVCAFDDCSGLTSVYVSDLAAYLNIDMQSTPMIYASKLYVNNKLVAGDIVIPDTVTEIPSSAFRKCDGITSVTVPDSVTNIGLNAFEGCYGITSITIPNSVTSIGQRAFYSCSGLISIAIPDSVTSINYHAFEGCSSLTNVTIGSGVTHMGHEAFTGCTGLTTVNYNATNCTDMGSSQYPVFKGCGALATVNIGDNVTNIPSYAFSDCSGLQTVYYEGTKDSWKNITIGSGNSLLTNANRIYLNEYDTETGYFEQKDGVIILYTGSDSVIQIPDNIGNNQIKSIANGVFKNNQSITEITIPATVSDIGAEAFSGCSNLQKVNLTENTETIGKDAFKGTPFWDNITDIYFGSHLVAVNSDKISDTYTIKEGTTKVSSDAFNGCTKLISVNMPDSLTAIGDRAYKGCTWLSDVNMPSSVKSIGEEAFEGCTWLRSIVIGSGVTDIGKMAFANCTGVTSVTIPESIENIGEMAFESCARITRVNIADIGKWCEINFATETSNPLYFASSIYINGRSVSVINIPDGVTSISSIAFCGSKALTGIKIPSTVSEIGNGAFYKCSNLNDVYITDIAKWCETEFEDAEANPMSCAENLYVNNEKIVNLTIPNSITKINPFAFYSCEGLETVNIKNSLVNDVTIGTNAFGSCSSLYTVTLPYCVTNIDSAAFADSDNVVFYVDADSTAYNYAKNKEYVLNGGKDISSATVEYTQSMMYSGNALTPTVSVKQGDKYLTENTDFKVWYLDNVNIGTAKILIYGIGNYRGYIEKTFEIRETSDITELYIGENAVVVQGQRINLKEPKSTYGTFESCTVQHDEDKAVNFTPNNYYSFSSYGVYKITYKEKVTGRDYVYGQGWITTSTILTTTSTVTVLNQNDPPKEPSASVSSIRMQANECNEKDRAYLLVSAYPLVSAEQTIRFRSSDTSVLTVDQYGVVTFVKPGKATVYAETVNGTVGTFEYDTAALNINRAEIISLKQNNNNEWKVKLKNRFGNLVENTDYTAIISENDNALNLEVTGIGLYGNAKNAVFDISTGVPISIQHSILTNVKNGDIILDETLASEGEEITFTITPASGYKLIDKSIKINGGDVNVTSNETGYSFIMPDKDVTITATFEKIPPEMVTVSFDANEGTLTGASTVKVEKGTTLSQSIIPTAEKDGHTFAGWLLNGKTFSLDAPITENITLTALWIENESQKSTTVPTLSKFNDIMDFEKSAGANDSVIFTVTKKGSATIPKPTIYVAHFGTDGTLQSADKFDFKKSGDTYMATIDRQTGDYKIFVWTDDTSSMLEPITAPLTEADGIFE